jgi:hypothetical protein
MKTFRKETEDYLEKKKTYLLERWSLGTLTASTPSVRENAKKN